MAIGKQYKVNVDEKTYIELKNRAEENLTSIRHEIRQATFRKTSGTQRSRAGIAHKASLEDIINYCKENGTEPFTVVNVTRPYDVVPKRFSEVCRALGIIDHRTQLNRWKLFFDEGMKLKAVIR